MGSTPPPLLLQVLQDASVAEVVDVPAEIHQLGVDICGHTAVGRGGEVRAAGHHAGAARWGTFGTPLHQGTKSTHTHRGWKKSTTNQIYLYATVLYLYLKKATKCKHNVYANTHDLVVNGIH